MNRRIRAEIKDTECVYWYTTMRIHFRGLIVRICPVIKTLTAICLNSQTQNPRHDGLPQARYITLPIEFWEEVVMDSFIFIAVFDAVDAKRVLEVGAGRGHTASDRRHGCLYVTCVSYTLLFCPLRFVHSFPSS